MENTIQTRQAVNAQHNESLIRQYEILQNQIEQKQKTFTSDNGAEITMLKNKVANLAKLDPVIQHIIAKQSNEHTQFEFGLLEHDMVSQTSTPLAGPKIHNPENSETSGVIQFQPPHTKPSEDSHLEDTASENSSQNELRRRSEEMTRAANLQQEIEDNEPALLSLNVNAQN